MWDSVKAIGDKFAAVGEAVLDGGAAVTETMAAVGEQVGEALDAGEKVFGPVLDASEQVLGPALDVGEHVGGAVLDGGAAIAGTSSWLFDEATEHLKKMALGQQAACGTAAAATSSNDPSATLSALQQPASATATAAVATTAVATAQGPPSDAVGGHSFAASRYKRLYEEMPRAKYAYELQRALHSFVRACASHPAMLVPAPEGDAFFGRLLNEALAAGGVAEILDEAALNRFAVRVWTSQQQWGGREFCSLLNQAVREDGTLSPATLRPAVMLCRAINDVLCCGNRASGASEWPSGPGALPPLLGQWVSASWSSEPDTTFRGGALPAEHEAFFAVGRRFRTSMFVATSFDEAVARQFMARAPADVQPVLWRVRFDPVRRCKHVNYVGALSTASSREAEFLFPPYSVFSVLRLERAQHHLIVELQAAVDNLHEPTELPLAPWS